MPLYQYVCKHCNNEFELRQSFSDDPADTCPNCGTVGEVHRLIQPAGVIFKGSGFYVTDNKRKNPAAPGSSKTSSTSSDNGSTSSNGATAEASTEKSTSNGDSSKS